MNEEIKMKESVRNEIKQIVIARLETLNQDAKIMLMGLKKTISVHELLNEVQNDTDLGKKIVEVQFSLLKKLANGEL